MSEDNIEPDLVTWRRQLQCFTENIQDCMAKSDWERLADVLDARQIYLERIFAVADSFPAQKKLLAKQLAQSILEQDADFISCIETQKKLSAAQQSALGLGRRAMQAYNSH